MRLHEKGLRAARCSQHLSVSTSVALLILFMLLCVLESLSVHLVLAEIPYQCGADLLYLERVGVLSSFRPTAVHVCQH